MNRKYIKPACFTAWICNSCQNRRQNCLPSIQVSVENTWCIQVNTGKVHTCPRLPQILAWMEGYICFSFMVIVISLSRIAVTRCRLASSLCLQKRTKFDSQGVMYSRQRCFNSIPEMKYCSEPDAQQRSFLLLLEEFCANVWQRLNHCLGKWLQSQVTYRNTF